MLEVIAKLILKFMPPDRLSSGAITQRVARLDHELGDHTVEQDALEVPAAGVSDEVLDGFRCLLREESHVYVAHRGVYRRGVSDG